MSLIAYLPERVYPEIYFDNSDNIDYSINGARYGDGHISCKRVFNITPDCRYIEYFDSYSGKSFQLVNADISVYTNGRGLSWVELRKYYPDIIDFNELVSIDRVPDFKRLMYEDLEKPLVRKDVEVSKIEKMVNSQSSSGNQKDLDLRISDLADGIGHLDRTTQKIFNVLNDLSRKVTILEGENIKLKQQINDLVDGQIPRDMSSNILENMFEE